MKTWKKALGIVGLCVGIGVGAYHTLKGENAWSIDCERQVCSAINEDMVFSYVNEPRLDVLQSEKYIVADYEGDDGLDLIIDTTRRFACKGELSDNPLVPPATHMSSDEIEVCSDDVLRRYEAIFEEVKQAIPYERLTKQTSP